MIYANCRSLNNKIEEFANILEFHHPDIAVLTETWGHCRPFVGYSNVFQSNRDIGCHSTARGGGVCIYVSDNLNVAGRDDLNGQYVECQWCDITTRNHAAITVGCIYRSTNQAILDIKMHDDNLLKMISGLDDKSCVLLLGDFNAPHIDWSNDISGLGPQSFDSRLLHTVKDKLLTQHVSFITRRCRNLTGNVLDLVFTRNVDSSRVYNLEALAPLGSSDHDMLVFNFQTPALSASTKDKQPKLNYAKGNYVRMNDIFQHSDWTVSNSAHGSLEDAWSELKRIHSQAVSSCVSLVNGNLRAKKKPWCDKNTVKAIKKKHNAWKKYTNSNNFLDEIVYAQVRDETNQKVINKRKQYEKNLVMRAKRYKNVSCIFRYIKSSSIDRSSINMIVDSSGQKHRRDVDIANALASFFSTIYSSEATEPLGVSYDNANIRILDNVEFNESLVIDILKNLDVSKACGTDSWSNWSLKRCKHILAKRLVSLFRKSMDEGKIPDDWKLSYVAPIYKGADAGRRADVKAYRPISLTSNVCKVMERIAKDNILFHLESNNLLNKFQHGFLPGKSCITNLIEMTNYITDSLDDGSPVNVAFLDFSKAFDKVSHNILLKKLYMCGIRGNLLKWLEDFLRGRRFKVKINCSTSDLFCASSGVPQGSVLGPLLFIIYVNDIPDVAPCHIKLFADDTKIAHKAVTPADDGVLQHALNKLWAWSIENRLPFNACKSKVLKISCSERVEMRVPFFLGPDAIDFCFQERDLGVLMTPTINPSSYISSITKKARSALGMIRTVFRFKEDDLMILLYKTLVRPYLEYCVQVWSPWKQGDIKKLEDVQRKATRMVPGCRGLQYPDRLEMCGLTTLEERRARGDMILVFRILNDLIPLNKNDFFQLDSSRRTRGHDYKLIKPRTHRTPRQNFFSSRVVTGWNSLPNDVVDADTVMSFKIRYDRHMAVVRQAVSASDWT